MAISPPSDIVLDVARAAEPAAVATARADLLRRTRAGGAAFDPGAALPVAAEVAGLSRSATPQALPEASKKFEAMVLQTFIASMLPKNAEGTYGQGIAGDMWKSMMAEKIADVVAERGGIGIAERVLGDFQTVGEAKVPLTGVTPAAVFGEGNDPAAVTTALVDQLQRRIAADIGTAATARTTGVFAD